jgi:hypothetical protein
MSEGDHLTHCGVCDQLFHSTNPDLHLCGCCEDYAWDVLEHHARTLDRSAACHTLRVRADQAAGQQRHVRRAVHA